MNNAEKISKLSCGTTCENAGNHDICATCDKDFSKFTPKNGMSFRAYSKKFGYIDLGFNLHGIGYVNKNVYVKCSMCDSGNVDVTYKNGDKGKILCPHCKGQSTGITKGQIKVYKVVPLYVQQVVFSYTSAYRIEASELDKYFLLRPRRGFDVRNLNGFESWRHYTLDQLETEFEVGTEELTKKVALLNKQQREIGKQLAEGKV